MSEILIYQNESGNIKVDVRFEEGELDEKVVVRNYRRTTKHGAIEGKTQTSDIKIYNLDMIIAIGFRVSFKYRCQI